MTPALRQRLAWTVWATMLVALDRRRARAERSCGRHGAARWQSGPVRLPSGAVAERSHVSFVHEGPTFDARLEHIMPQVASMGASVAVADFDRDGWQDFYVTNSRENSLNRLYRNKGDGTFEDVATCSTASPT